MRGLFLLFLCLFLSGCAWLAPNYQREAFDMPSAWEAQTATSVGKTAVYQDWWKSYQDPSLDALIQEALVHNDDLSVAAARVMQAKAQYDYAFANQFPLLSLTGYGSRSKMDFKDSALLSDKPSNIGILGGMLSYEVDLWGKLASASESARAAYLSMNYNKDAVRLGITSAVAQLYFNILSLDADTAHLRQLIKLQEETFGLTNELYSVSAVDARALHQAEAKLADVKGKLPELLDQKSRAESAMATLLGRSPTQIVNVDIARNKKIEDLVLPSIVPPDVPSEILERRPDIAAQESALIASNFNIGYARAAYFPSLSVSNLLGVTSLGMDNLYKGTVRTWELSGTLAGPLVDFGRTSSGVDLALAENQERLALYKQTVKTAFKEVRDALSAQINAKDIDTEETAKIASLRSNLQLEQLRLAQGYASRLDVLSGEAMLCQAQISGVSARLNQLNVSVELFKALGGGWTPQISGDTL